MPFIEIENRSRFRVAEPHGSEEDHYNVPDIDGVYESIKVEMNPLEAQEEGRSAVALTSSLFDPKGEEPKRIIVYTKDDKGCATISFYKKVSVSPYISPEEAE